ncbi:LamG-like jellyroll fold domain-containing protein, partial [Mangrovimonas yunxiaonensis]|uniref:LamG-like jellyroll fold domain-containing protein n=1 Tax=Mangrovimonas yunxiaonensis TaxID=1197477 RepID=UPI00166D9DA9
AGIASGGQFPVGTTTNTFVITDAAGRTATCSFDVTVVDDENPNAVCQNITIQLDAAGNASIVAADINNGSSDNCGSVTLSASQTAFDCSGLGNNNVTLTVTDAVGNTDTCIAVVTVEDNITPVIPTLSTIEEQCSATVPVPTATDNCGGVITGTTSSPLTYTAQGLYYIIWTFNDGNGNEDTATQTVFINDSVDPVANCQNITVALSDTTGTASITASQINNGSTDNCNVGNLTYTLSQSTFDCTDIGPNVITLTVTDDRGNFDTCTATVTVTSPTITGGTLIGHLVDGSGNPINTNPDSNIIEVTACPDEPQYALLNLSGYSGNIIGYEVSTDGGISWNFPSNNTTNTTYTSVPITQTTLIRAVIAIGSCEARSNIVYLAVIPPDIPPTIINHGDLNICLGNDITVVAQSEFGINPDLTEGGLFNTSNLNNLGWLVDGMAAWDASGNTGNDTYWKGTNGPKNFNNKCYDSPEGDKFGIASGIPPYDSPNHTITPLTTLETPIFNTLGLSTATLEFDQAYFLEAGAWVKIELSLDDGATYPITLDPGPTYNYTGPSSTTFGDEGFGGGGPSGCNGRPQTYVDNHVSIDLQDYIGRVGLRVKFTYHGTANSAWALENITIPQAPVDEVIEWTDENGVVVTTGSTTTITPVTPGIQTYGVTSLINGCRSDGDEGTEFINVSASLSYAGENYTQISSDCGGDIVQLNAYDNRLTALQNHANGAWDSNYQLPVLANGDTDYPGTGENGFWTAQPLSNPCSNNYTFSNPGEPNSTFTADPGTYRLTWTVAGCPSTIDVVVNNCDNIDFDGSNDYISFEDNYDLKDLHANSNFSVEAWVKPHSTNETRTVLSKKIDSVNNAGYDFSIVDHLVQFNWYSPSGNGNITSNYEIGTDRWYHIAVTFNGTYKLYVDGIDVGTISGSVNPPETTPATTECILGAVDNVAGPDNNSTKNFHGWIDEVRIWNTALNVDQIRMMMNQEIRDNAGAVRGEVIPLDIPGLNWANLNGYYRMDKGCGALAANKGAEGRLMNIFSNQNQTAPLPYTSRVDNQNWTDDDTWTHFSVWDTPNSNGIDDTPIDWNIVRTNHDINSGDKNITVLGLLSETANKELTIADPGSTQDETNLGRSLRVTHYLLLDGDIDLVGESQLLQDQNSILDVSSGGKLERDQQGTSNLYNYNYWSSPVSTINTSANNTPFSISGILRDGSNTNTPQNIAWIGGHNATGATNPITITRRWIYAFYGVSNTYSEWDHLTENGTLSPGLGYTMKGSGVGDPVTDVQNYVFVGKPNNGSIIYNNLPNGNSLLVGNPYPSAVDADAFIKDNIPDTNPDGSPSDANPDTSGSIEGSLYFWVHYASNNTHILADYQGGYAVRNLTEGIPPVTPPITVDGYEISGLGSSSLTPTQYIPVGQGFFIGADTTPGGEVRFHNSQRIFRTETDPNVSIFARTTNNTAQASSESMPASNKQLIRLTAKIGTNEQNTSKRHLLLGFIPNSNASAGFDYGYDAENIDDFPSDVSFVIDNKSYVIQGVNAFNDENMYPLKVVLANNNTVEIDLESLEHFDDDIDVFIYDAVEDSYHQINNMPYTFNLTAGTYNNRYFVTFTADNSLSVADLDTQQIVVNYLNSSSEILIKTPTNVNVKQVTLISILGQTVMTWNNDNQTFGNEIKIPVTRVSQGGYIVKVDTKSGGSISKKIIVN